MIRPLLKFKRLIKRTFRVREDINLTEAHQRRRILVKYAMAVLAVIGISFFYPLEDFMGPLDVPREGEMAVQNIIAEFPFAVTKNPEQIEEERRRAVSACPLYLDFSDDIAQQNISRLKKLLTAIDTVQKAGPTAARGISRRLAAGYPFLTPELLERLTRNDHQPRLKEALIAVFTEDIYQYGILADTSELPAPYTSIIVGKKKRDLLMVRDQVIDGAGAYKNLLALLTEKAQEAPFDVELAYDLGRNFVQANVAYNDAKTKAARDSAAAAVSTTATEVAAGELLARRGGRIDAAQARLIAAYADELSRQTMTRGGWAAALPLIGRIILVGMLMLLLYVFLYFFRPDVYWSNNKLLALFVIIALELILVNIIGAQMMRSVYLYPIAILSILVTILFDSRLGVLMTLLTALLLGLLNRFDFTIAIITAVTGSIAAFASGGVRRRSSFYRIIISLSGAYVITALAVEALRLSPTVDILTACGYGLANGFVSPMVTIGILPFFESVFGFTTNVTLLELADLNQPLLKRLAIEAPGTYHHSIVVGNLAEAGAKQIGANPLLARVGAYYHDIGKMEIPEYFVENQLGIKSRHESLNPTMSALVLASHVKRGRKLGEDSGLPDAVLNFVEEHHGTTMMSYFYNKAKEMGMPVMSEDDFRYPGPKPQTKETAIVMLADSTEAASRTLDNPTPARIRNLIQRLINDKFTSGELTECDLTLKDLNDIREAFVSILIGVFHQRVAYPRREAGGGR